jgi:hypothetical protein
VGGYHTHRAPGLDSLDKLSQATGNAQAPDRESLRHACIWKATSMLFSWYKLAYERSQIGRNMASVAELKKSFSAEIDKVEDREDLELNKLFRERTHVGAIDYEKIWKPLRHPRFGLEARVGIERGTSPIRLQLTQFIREHTPDFVTVQALFTVICSARLVLGHYPKSARQVKNPVKIQVKLYGANLSVAICRTYLLPRPISDMALGAGVAV